MVLIANRGEIARRILRTCRKLGLVGVALHTPAEADQLWVLEADRAVQVSSYLAAQEIIEAGLRVGVGAVHPGFGFLAESPEFARQVGEAGLTWVGPGPEAMAQLSCKMKAKDLARSLGIPVLEKTDQPPLLIKAAAGGGGKGMRVVLRAEELPEALESARLEAERAFGDGSLLLEPYLLEARHIEVQLLGDQHGRMWVLGERDCSLQRRHQKILEECPAHHLPQREDLYRAALELGRAAGYSNAGTVEFLVNEDGFYFLEVNTRLQVEHPVTEEVYGLDLVEWQLRVASGEPLPDEPPRPKGHAVEVRLYAEDPARDFAPSPGQILVWQPPPEIRVETALCEGQTLSPDYDPMVAKLIAHGEDRPQALRRLRRALERTLLLGVECNRDFLHYWLGRTLEGEVLTTQSLQSNQWKGGLDAASEQAVQFFLEQPQQWDGQWMTWSLQGSRQRHRFQWQGQRLWVAGAVSQGWKDFTPPSPSGPQEDPTQLRAPHTGRVLELAAVGEAVQLGQCLGRLEAMKMVHTLQSGLNGKVERVHVQVGQVVKAKSLLLELRAEDA